MGFDIEFNFREPSAERNEALASSLLSLFPTLQRFPLDFDAIASSIGVPRDQVLSKWCQIELDDNGGNFGGAIITFWPKGIIVQLPSRPMAGSAATLEILSPLFAAMRAAGAEIDPSFDILSEYEMQRGRVEKVARIVGEGG
jgi:hypothetical protein